jgi:integrase
MASISRDANGRRRIQFLAADGVRKGIRLGKVSQRIAEEIKVKVEALNAAIIAGCSIDGETAQWVAKLGDELHAKLAGVGLVPARQTESISYPSLGEFVDSFIAARTDHKRNTRNTFTQTKNALLHFFGADKPLNTITPGDADDWKVDLRSRGYAPATIGTFVKRARQMFRYATRKGLLVKSPFADLKAPTQVNKSREVYVTRETTQKVIDACPSAEWRLLVALARYGGLRTPSESLNLRLTDVDWENDRITVTSPKTEHLPGKGSRVIPLFPELRPYLEDVFELARPGTVYVINRYRDGDTNLRTQLQRIIRKAGVPPWERLWQNLRSSRETELAETFPLHVVTAWIGNTERVASKHYLQVTDDHFTRAVQGGAKSGAEVVQNPVQQPAAPDGRESHETQKALKTQGFCETMRVDASPCGVSDYPRQESNLVFDRRRVACASATPRGLWNNLLVTPLGAEKERRSNPPLRR